MDAFFTVDGQILSVNQDCSLTEYATYLEAFSSNPICVIQSQATYENVLVQGRNEKRFQNNKYLLFQPNRTQKVDSLKVGSWSIKDLLEPRRANSLHFDVVDPLGKVIRQMLSGDNRLQLLTHAFLKVREMNNYESALNYKLIQENLRLKQELDSLRKQLASHMPVGQ